MKWLNFNISINVPDDTSEDELHGRIINWFEEQGIDMFLVHKVSEDYEGEPVNDEGN